MIFAKENQPKQVLSNAIPTGGAYMKASEVRTIEVELQKGRRYAIEAKALDDQWDARIVQIEK